MVECAACLPRTAQRVGLLLIACVTGAPVQAFDWGLTTRTGYTHTDNVAQAPRGESASILASDLSAAVEHVSRTLVLDAEANYIYRYFLDDSYASEAQPQLRGELEWSPIPERFRLNVSDVYGQLALNPAEGLLPSQYENANVLTVAPTLLWPFSVDSRMQLTGEYRVAKFDAASADSQRRFVELRAGHDLTGLITLFGGVATSRTEFDMDSVTGFDVDSVFVGIDAVGRRSALTLDVGMNYLQSEGGQKFDGARYDLTYERRLRSDITLFVGATREIADAADVFSLAQMSDAALSGIRDVQVTAQPLVRQAYMLGLSRSSQRLSLGFTAGYRQERFEIEPQDLVGTSGTDRDIRELQLEGEYVFSPATSVLARVEALHERFESGVSSDDLLSTVAWLRRLSTRMSFEARAQLIQRNNSPRNFDELRYFVFVRYALRELPAGPDSAFNRRFERRVRRIRDHAGAPQDESSRTEPASNSATNGED
jgi:hypothetical protein